MDRDTTPEDIALDHIEAAVYEDPRSGLTLARQSEIRCIRYWAIVGNALRQLERHEEAEGALRRALESPGPPFDLADAYQKLGQLLTDRHRWREAHGAVAAAVEIHTRTGLAAGLSGPPDRGLPGVLVVRGTLHAYAHDRSAECGDPIQAQADYCRALELAPNPDLAPLVHISAVHNLSVLSIETGRGLTRAQAALAQVRRRLAELGVPSTSPAAARVRWARAVVDWVLLGGSSEYGGRFVRRIERQLVTARRHLQKSGAHFDALLVGFDLGLLYLEHRQVDASHRTRPAPRWDDLRELTLEAFHLDWTDRSDVAAAVVFWRQASLEESFPAVALDFVYGRVRGLRRPDPKLHAHGERWGGGLRATSASAVFHLSTSRAARRVAPPLMP